MQYWKIGIETVGEKRTPSASDILCACSPSLYACAQATDQEAGS